MPSGSRPSTKGHAVSRWRPRGADMPLDELLHLVVALEVILEAVDLPPSLNRMRSGELTQMSSMNGWSTSGWSTSSRTRDGGRTRSAATAISAARRAGVEPASRCSVATQPSIDREDSLVPTRVGFLRPPHQSGRRLRPPASAAGARACRWAAVGGCHSKGARSGRGAAVTSGFLSSHRPTAANDGCRPGGTAVGPAAATDGVGAARTWGASNTRSASARRA